MDPEQGPPPPDPLIGQTVGNYLVTQKLGEGGMGAVYLAEHPGIGKKIALKVLHSEFSSNHEVADRFFNEARAVNNIGHPNIVEIHDYGVIQGGTGREQLVYFIMEYLAGYTLSQLIRSEAPLPPERAFSIAMQIADALSASHRCGIVHRDLKPDNIILLHRGRERDFVKLLDFGIAKLTGDAAGSSRTRTGIVMGTPAYMSPEQCEGRGSVDLRTDVYALGILVYEMLTGRVPFIGEGYGEILVQHLTQRPLPPSQYRLLPAHVEVVVLKALEKRADLRYPTMDEMMRAMADPVGYVEAHGGCEQFLRRELMPSNAPLPNGRLTPPPFTPAPGTIPSIHGGYVTPTPTTLGSATGEVEPRRSKAGFVLASLLVVAGAAVGVAVVMTGETVETRDVGGAQASDSIPADPGSDLGRAEGSDTGSADADEGSGTVPSTGSGSAAPATGSAGAAPVPRTVETSTIRISTVPPGATIMVGRKTLPEKTPEPFAVPRSASPVTIKLKLEDYQAVELKNFSVDKDVIHDVVLVKKKKPSITTIPGRGSNTSTGNNPGRGSNASTGNKPGRGSNADRGSGTSRPNDTQLEKP